jgi:hypothetical protein
MPIFEVPESIIAVQPEELNVALPYIAEVKDISHHLYPYSPS